MNKNKYRQSVREYFNTSSWDVTSLEMNFPTLLNSVAVALFIKKDITSDLAKETIRRLKQLWLTGMTDS